MRRVSSKQSMLDLTGAGLNILSFENVVAMDIELKLALSLACRLIGDELISGFYQAG